MKTTMNIIYPTLAAFVLACFVVSPRAQALVPPPDGGYPGANTAEGKNALLNLTSGIGDTAVGHKALLHNTTGTFNVGIGAQALFSNITGNGNTANGSQALYFNTADRNTANGAFALFSNTNGIENTATGFQALFSNVGVADPNHLGSYNTANGGYALFFNTTGDSNTAIGEVALYSNTTGGGNTAIGDSALVSQITGNQNIVLGYAAGQDLTDGGVNIYIANQGVPAENRTIRIGNVVSWTDIYGFGHPAHTATYIAGIYGATASGGTAVYINSDGNLGTLTSSARFKTDINPMDKASEAILSLKPVTFRYKHEIDPKGIPQFGLVAEDVEKVNPELVARDADGKPYTVRYEAVNAMLLNEFLKEHRKVEQMQKQIDALSEGLQKVSAQLEVSKPAPQVVNNQ